jgi:NDP-sugar pyrophosphorylase family protein
VARAKGEAGMIPVAILCGGLGTRLGELAKNIPKPMIEIGGRPYLERVVESFAECGLCDLVMLTGHRAEMIESHFGDGSRFGARIAYSRESEPLGTGGALREARHFLAQRFLMTYCDVLRRFDYDRFVQRHRGNCLAVYPRLDAGNCDAVDSRLTRFDKQAPELPFVDAGFSVMAATTLDLLPSSGPSSFEEIVFPRLVADGQLEAEIVDHAFFDIGTPGELARTRESLERA